MGYAYGRCEASCLSGQGRQDFVVDPSRWIGISLRAVEVSL